MFATILLGSIGCLLGPPGAIALGGLGAVIDATSDYDAPKEAPEEDPVIVLTKEDIQWNAHKQVWETGCSNPQYAKGTEMIEPSPTRATTSRWVDPVDPEFQV